MGDNENHVHNPDDLNDADVSVIFSSVGIVTDALFRNLFYEFDVNYLHFL